MLIQLCSWQCSGEGNGRSGWFGCRPHTYFIEGEAATQGGPAEMALTVTPGVFSHLPGARTYEADLLRGNDTVCMNLASDVTFPENAVVRNAVGGRFGTQHQIAAVSWRMGFCGMGKCVL